MPITELDAPALKDQEIKELGQTNTIRLWLKPRNLAWILGTCVFTLISLHLIGLLLFYNSAFSATRLGRQYIRLFNVDLEANLPTAYSGVALALAGIQLAFIAICMKHCPGKKTLAWWGLSALFFLLAADELALLHETFGKTTEFLIGRKGVEVSSWFRWAWVLPALLFVLLFGIVYAKFFFNLPKRWRWLFFISGATFVGGAVGLEMVGGHLVTEGGFTIGMRLVGTTEEAMEMSGVALFNYALADYIAAHFSHIHISSEKAPIQAEGGAIDVPSQHSAGPVSKWAIHRRMYNWVLSFATHKHSTTALFVMSFAESSFFPIPPDVLLGPLCLGKREKAWWFATITTIASVLGAVVGYCIGWGLWESVGPWLYTWVPGFTEEKFALVHVWYDRWGVWVLFAAAFTPIPFKVFTIAGGVFGQPLLPFLLVSLVGRGMRFYLVAGLFWWIGPKAEPFIEKYFNWLCLLFVILLAGGFAIMKLMH